MKSFQEKLISVPFHQLTFHNQIPKELIYYDSVTEFSPLSSLQRPTLLTLVHVHSCHVLENKENVLQLVQDPYFIGLILCTDKPIVIEEEIIDIFTQCEIPVIQIENPIYLHIFQHSGESFFSFNQLGMETEGIHLRGIEQQIDKLANVTGTPVLLLDQHYQVIGQAGTPHQIDQISAWLNLHRKELKISERTHPTEEPMMAIHQYLLFILHVTGDTTYTLLVGGHLVTWQKQLVNKLAGLIVLMKQTELKIKKQMENFKNHFIHDLFFNNIISKSLIIQMGESLGWDLRKPHHLLAIHTRHGEERLANLTWIDKVEKHLAIQSESMNEKIITFQFAGQWIVLLEDDKMRTSLERKEYILKIARIFHDLLLKNWPDVRFFIGIGNCYAASELHKSYREASLTLHFMQQWLTNKQVCHINDLGVYHLLLYTPKEVLYRFSEGTLGGLIDSDKELETDYIRALQCYFKNNGNMNEVAEEMYVHPNTLRNWFKRIEEITGLKMQEPVGCMNLHLAIIILSFLNSTKKASVNNSVGL